MLALTLWYLAAEAPRAFCGGTCSTCGSRALHRRATGVGPAAGTVDRFGLEFTGIVGTTTIRFTFTFTFGIVVKQLAHAAESDSAPVAGIVQG